MRRDNTTGFGAEDQRLEEVFRALNAPSPADDFTRAVMRRIGRRARIRRFVLGSSAAAGVLLSAAAVSRALVTWQASADTTDWPVVFTADPSGIALGLMLLAAPFAAQYLAR